MNGPINKFLNIHMDIKGDETYDRNTIKGKKHKVRGV
jgi:hypothetical protein